MKPLLLQSAAAVIVLVAFLHCYLGEKYLLQRLFRREGLPKLMGSEAMTKRLIRFAWHVTALAWLGLAGVLLAIAGGASAPMIVLVIGVAFFLQFALSLIASRGKHLSWPLFGLIALMCLLAAH